MASEESFNVQEVRVRDSRQNVTARQSQSVVKTGVSSAGRRRDLERVSPRVFLAAEWRYLAMLNYVVPPALLLPLVPSGTELDDWQGRTFVSVVGFLFRNTRVLGVPIPWHRNFEELNLRFYVRRTMNGEERRAVTFIKELVPRRAIAAVARLAYNEPYQAVPMRHTITPAHGSSITPDMVEYSWRHGGRWGRLSVRPRGEPSDIEPGSEEEFITEHYWGYTRQRDGGTMEYQVQHPRWRVWQVSNALLDGDMAGLYGERIAEMLRQPPSSAFLADGSEISVFTPRRI